MALLLNRFPASARKMFAPVLVAGATALAATVGTLPASAQSIPPSQCLSGSVDEITACRMREIKARCPEGSKNEAACLKRESAALKASIEASKVRTEESKARTEALKNDTAESKARTEASKGRTEALKTQEQQALRVKACADFLLKGVQENRWVREDILAEAGGKLTDTNACPIAQRYGFPVPTSL